MNIVVVIVTKDRPDDLHRCLSSLRRQTITFNCMVVDGSTTAEPVVQSFGYQYYQSQPGITKQRNVARQHIPADTDIVIYCDDDTVWSPNVLELVKKDFEHRDIIGLTGHFPEQSFGFFKKMFGRMTCTYSSKPYSVTPGIFNIINPVSVPQPVSWLPGAFMCYRWSAVQDIPFDEWFSAYGLAEDFDFSYRVGKVGQLWADPDIVVEHHHSPLNRDWKKFGYMRIKNRAYLRKKFWPKRLDVWLGMWWANIWLLAINAIRGLCSARFREEFLGEIKALFK